jgi:hypothetical protein
MGEPLQFKYSLFIYSDSSPAIIPRQQNGDGKDTYKHKDHPGWFVKPG